MVLLPSLPQSFAVAIRHYLLRCGEGWYSTGYVPGTPWYNTRHRTDSYFKLGLKRLSHQGIFEGGYPSTYDGYRLKLRGQIKKLPELSTRFSLKHRVDFLFVRCNSNKLD